MGSTRGKKGIAVSAAKKNEEKGTTGGEKRKPIQSPREDSHLSVSCDFDVIGGEASCRNNT